MAKKTTTIKPKPRMGILEMIANAQLYKPQINLGRVKSIMGRGRKVIGVKRSPGSLYDVHDVKEYGHGAQIKMYARGGGFIVYEATNREKNRNAPATHFKRIGVTT